MVKGILFFVLIWFIILVSIKVFRMLTGREKWNLVKTLGYSALTALITLISVVLFVAVF